MSTRFILQRMNNLSSSRNPYKPGDRDYHQLVPAPRAFEDRYFGLPRRTSRSPSLFPGSHRRPSSSYPRDRTTAANSPENLGLQLVRVRLVHPSDGFLIIEMERAAEILFALRLTVSIRVYKRHRLFGFDTARRCPSQFKESNHAV